MNLNILTSGTISAKFGIRPALMYAALKDLSQHSVIRVVGDEASGWIGIAYGHLITGAKCQADSGTFSGLDALEILLGMDQGVFDLIQIDNRLLGDELSHAIGINIDELLSKLQNEPESQSLHEMLQSCRRMDDAISILMATGVKENEIETNSQASSEKQVSLQEQVEVEAVQDGPKAEPVADPTQPEDEDWHIDFEPPSQNLMVLYEQVRRSRGRNIPTAEIEFLVLRTEHDAKTESGSEPGGIQTERDSGRALETNPGPLGFRSASGADFADPKPGNQQHLPSPVHDAATALSRQDQAFDSGFEIEPVQVGFNLNSERLSEDLRAELHEFVRQQFGVDERKFFEDLDLEQSSSYQASVVLKDLELAIEKAKIDLGSSGSFYKLAESLESCAEAAGVEALAAWRRAKESESSGNSFYRKGVSLEEHEDSRRIFAEQVRKNASVDTKEFLAAQDSDKKLEYRIFDEKRMRNLTIVTASVILLISGGYFFYHAFSRQSSLDAASSLLQAGNLKAARLAYENILAVNPNNWQAYLGHALSVPDDIKLQVRDYEQVLRIQPKDYAAALALARAHYDLKDYLAAAAAARRAHEINKSSVAALKIQADALIKSDKYADAAKVLEEALSLQSNHQGELYYTLFLCYKKLDLTEKQKQSLTKALSFDPGNATYLKEHLFTYAVKSGPSQYKKELERALRIIPSDGQLHYELAKLHLRSGEEEKALAELSLAVEHGYATADSLGLRGRLYFSRKMYGYARVDLKEALLKDPGRSDLKQALLQAENAIVIAQKQAGSRKISASGDEDEELDPSELQGDFLGRAYSLMKESKVNQASRILKAAVRSFPSDMRARRYLADCLYLQGNYAESARQFAYASAAQALSADELLIYGKALIKLNRLEQAINILKELLSQDEQNSKARVQLIKAYLLAGFNDHARQECQEGLKQARNSQEYAEIKSLMP